MNNLYSYIGAIFNFFTRVYYYFLRKFQAKKLNVLNKEVYIGKNCNFSYENIIIGDKVYIGDHCSFISSISKIIIKNYVMFGPNVTIRGGNHRYNKLGTYMYDVKEKLPENDSDVIIENDVWVGSNVTILSGVTVGKGSIIGAGSVVTNNVPQYSIYVGNKVRTLYDRFTKEEIKEHEKILFKGDRK